MRVLREAKEITTLNSPAASCLLQSAFKYTSKNMKYVLFLLYTTITEHIILSAIQISCSSKKRYLNSNIFMHLQYM